MSNPEGHGILTHGVRKQRSVDPYGVHHSGSTRLGHDHWSTPSGLLQKKAGHPSHGLKPMVTVGALLRGEDCEGASYSQVSMAAVPIMGKSQVDGIAGSESVTEFTKCCTKRWTSRPIGCRSRLLSGALCLRKLS